MDGTLAGRRYDAALNLLDRQIIDPDGRLVGNVDDVELTERDDGRLAVTAILVGPGVLGPRLGGRLGRWTVAGWRRLRADGNAKPGRIDAADISRIDSAVHLSVRPDEPGIDGLERWVDEHVISRIPGATHEPE
jgi:sporulation protein YlmC with PRC-barrel domain